MRRTSLFHLYLHIAVGRIHIVELLHARSPEVGLLFCVQIFIQMKQHTLAAQEQAQVIESGILIVAFTVRCSILVKQRCAQQQQRAEIEVITKRTILIVDDRMRYALPLLHRVTVTVDHGSLHVIGHEEHAVQSRRSNQ